MIYIYECPRCGKRYERVCRLAEYEQHPGVECAECFVSMKRFYTVPRVFTKSFEPFRSPVDGSVITNSRELSEHNKRNNVVPLHDGYDEAAVKKFTETDWQKPLDQERKQDLGQDMEKAIQKLEQGYKPTPAPFTEEPPDEPA